MLIQPHRPRQGAPDGLLADGCLRRRRGLWLPPQPPITLPQQAAISVAQAPTYVWHASSAARAFGSNVTAGNLIVALVIAIYEGTGTVTVSVSDSLGNSYAEAASAKRNVSSGGFTIMTSVWYAKNIAGGACTVTLAGVSNFDGLTLAPVEVAGCDTASPEDGSNSATGTGTGPSTSVTTSAADTIAFGVNSHFWTSNISSTPGAGYTLVQESENIANNTVFLTEYQIFNGSGAKTVNCTLGASRQWLMSGVAFKAAEAAGAAGATLARRRSSLICR
jgi:hypothetical protein